jgi:large conductance mechanosensitive channel
LAPVSAIGSEIASKFTIYPTDDPGRELRSPDHIGIATGVKPNRGSSNGIATGTVLARRIQAFIARGSVVDLAVGVIIGASFGGIVTSLVKDVLNPVIGVFLGGVDFTNIFIPLNGKHYDTLALAQTAGAPTVNIGLFINAIIQFLIMAFVIFWVVKVLSRINLRNLGAAAPPPTKTETLLTEIRDLLKAAPPA